MVTKHRQILLNIGWVALLFFFWLLGSFFDFEIYLPRWIPALIVIGLCFIVAVVAGLKWALARREYQQPKWVWFVALWALVAVLYIIVFPLAQKKVDIQKNDSYDAIFVTSTQLLHGHFPYYVRTFAGAPPSPMPGALFLALPFLVLGRESLQNIFWLGIFIWFATRYFRFRSTALAFLLVAVLANAHTMVNLLDGADYGINWMYICTSVFLFLSSIEQGSRWKFVASGILLGVAFSSRPTYVLVFALPLLAYLAQRIGFMSALRRIALPLAVTIAVTVPFYLYDPAHFTPFHVTDRLVYFPPWLQHPMAILLITFTMVTACAGFFVRLTLPRLFLVAGIGSTVLLVTPALITAFLPVSRHLILLGYSDAPGCFLALWAFRCMEEFFTTSNTRHASPQPGHASLEQPCAKLA